MSYSEGKRRSSDSSRNSLWWRGIPGEEHVLKLDTTNYDRILSTSDSPALVMFYAQWCGYSVSARKDFAAAAAQLAQDGTPVLFGAVDCDQCEQLRDRYREITGYPSFIYFVKGSPRVNYHAQRSTAVFVAWIRKMQALQQ